MYLSPADVAAHPGADVISIAEQYRVLFERHPVPMGIWDRETLRFLAVNDAAVAQYGWSRAEFLGLTILDLVAPESLPAARERLATEPLDQPYHSRHRQTWLHRRKDGTRLEAELYSDAITFNGRAARLVMAEDVTARRRHDESLRASEELNRTIVEHSSDCVKTLSLDGTILTMNVAGAALMGLADPCALVGTNWFSVWDGEHRTAAMTAAAAAREGGLGRFEAACRTAGGEFRWWDVAITPVRGPDGAPARLLAVSRDITEQRARALELAESEARYTTLFDTVRDGIYILDTDGRFLQVNRAVCECYGYTREQLIGQSPAFLAARGTPAAEAALARVREVAEGGEPRTFEWWGRTASGRELPKEVTLTRGTLGGETVVIAVARDLSERHLAEARIRESETRFRTLVEAAPLGVVIRRGMEIVYANAAAHRMFGVPADAPLAATSVLDVIAPEQHAVVAERARRRDAGEPLSTVYETVGRRRDGTTFPLHLANAELTLSDGPGVLVFLSDESERRATEEQLRHSQRMEAVGRLAGGVAHDFNNLLTAILSYCSVILGELPDGHPIRDDVEQIRAAGERAATLTRQLLAFGRRQLLQPKPVVLNTVVADVDRLLRRMIGEDVELVTELDPALGTALADPGQLEQILMNLAVNARDAMPRGGRLTIRTRNARLNAAAAARLRYVRPGAYVQLTVEDTGTGIPADVMPHIFEPFFTTKEQGKGTGLGLSTVYGIVKQSGGSIFATNVPGAGARFTIYLPTTGEAAGARAEPLPAGPAPRPKAHETVLLVEDDPIVRRLTRDLLSRGGYRVLEAADGEAALRIAETRDSHIDAIVTDVVMPRMSGRQLVEQLPDHRRSVPVLYVSGYTEEAVLKHGVHTSAAAFLPKPYTPETLSRKLREVLDTAQAGAALASPDPRP